tara:strand:- start:1554 stop:3368 length:1815 start_codon:yes stop_codon:yes gene_type:complete
MNIETTKRSKKKHSRKKKTKNMSHELQHDVPQTFYPEDISAATEIYKALSHGNHKKVNLVAEMMSGKSDSSLLSVCIILLYDIVNNVIISSAYSDNYLREQWENTLKRNSEFEEKLTNYFMTLPMFNKKEKSYVRKTASGIIRNIEVIFCCQMKKKKEVLSEFKLTNTAIIFDESHIGQSDKQRQEELLKMFDIDPTGISNDGKHRLINVSATGYSDLNAHEKNNKPYPIIYKNPGKNYKGLKTFYKSNCFVKYSKKEGPNDLMAHFNKVCIEINENRGNSEKKSTCLLREPRSQKKCYELRLTAHKYQLSYKQFDQKWKKNKDFKDYWHLSEAEALDQIIENTVGIITFKRKLSAGGRIKKTNVHSIFETCESNGDTLNQGLIGRMCGYPESGTNTEIKIYILEKSMREIESHIYMMDQIRSGVSITDTPSGMNLKKSQNSEFKSTTFKSVVKKIKIDPSEFDEDINNTKLDTKCFLRDKIMECSDPRDEKNKLLFDNLNNCEDTIKINNLQKKSFDSTPLNISFKDELEQSFQNNTVITKIGAHRGVNDDEVRIFYDGNLNLQRLKAERKSFIIYVYHRSYIRHETDISPLPEIKKKCIYIH